jgi:hypothetical protein
MKVGHGEFVYLYLRGCGVNWHRKVLGPVAGLQSGLEDVFQRSSGSSTNLFKCELNGSFILTGIFSAISQNISLL